MSPYQRFPDVQVILVNWLTGLAGVTAAGIETPEDFTGQLPFVRVLRTGGPSDWLNDYPTVDIDVFAELYADGESLAERVRQALVGPPPAMWQVDKVYAEVAPRELPWGDGRVRRWNATYSLTCRRVSAI